MKYQSLNFKLKESIVRDAGSLSLPALFSLFCYVLDSYSFNLNYLLKLKGKIYEFKSS